MRAGRFGRRAPEARERARELRRDQTYAEHWLWDTLRDRRLGWKFRRQVPVDSYVVDFYCAELKLVVEVDGEIHLDPRQVAHDKSRDTHLRSIGCTILRFFQRIRRPGPRRRPPPNHRNRLPPRHSLTNLHPSPACGRGAGGEGLSYTPSTFPSTTTSPASVASVSSSKTPSPSRSQNRSSPRARQKSASPSPSRSPSRG